MLGGCVQLAPPAIVEIIVGAIVGVHVGAGVAITLTTTHNPRSATLDLNPRIG